MGKFSISFLVAILSVATALDSHGKGTATPSDTTGISLKSVEVFVEYTSAKVFGDITVDQKPERISEVQVQYGTASDALTESVKANYDTNNGYSADIISLEDGVQYFYRVDIIVGEATMVGKVRDFVTFPIGPIDLDLPSGNKWASHNVGASCPTEVGGYYAWGELTEKTQYDWTSYQHCNGAVSKLTKYSYKPNTSYNGRFDGLKELQPEDDVATATLGEHYSLPSYRDWQELMDFCVLTPVVINGCRGCKVSSKKDMNNNKKFIFLPGSKGYYKGTSRQSGASYYWSSTLHSTVDHSVLNMMVYDRISNSRGERCCGEQVRAVYK